MSAVAQQKTGRPPSCLCGACEKCQRRVRARERYQRMTLEERREWVGRRDPEKVNAADRRRYYRHREERLARMREWEQANRDRTNELSREWAKRNPEKRAAHIAVGNAIRDGHLKRQPCEECGTEDRVQAHHDDYSKPLDVRWLCSTHHGEVHRQYHEGALVA